MRKITFTFLLFSLSFFMNAQITTKDSSNIIIKDTIENGIAIVLNQDTIDKQLVAIASIQEEQLAFVLKELSQFKNILRTNQLLLDSLKLEQVESNSKLLLMQKQIESLENQLNGLKPIENLKLEALSNYKTLVECALKNNYIKSEDLKQLITWNSNPSEW